MADDRTGETTLGKAVLAASLQPGMLCLADRNFFGFDIWGQARDTGADLLWRIKKNLRLACEKRLPDGSYLSRIYACEKDQRHKTNGVTGRRLVRASRGASTTAWTVLPMPSRSIGW